MLIRFKSKASADLIMLEEHAKRVLEMMGKPSTVEGIVCAEDLPQVLQRLEQALLSLEGERKQQQDPEHEDAVRSEGGVREVSWAQRAQPMQKMPRMALKHQTSITWGT